MDSGLPAFFRPPPCALPNRIQCCWVTSRVRLHLPNKTGFHGVRIRGQAGAAPGTRIGVPYAVCGTRGTRACGRTLAARHAGDAGAQKGHRLFVLVPRFLSRAGQAVGGAGLQGRRCGRAAVHSCPGSRACAWPCSHRATSWARSYACPGSTGRHGPYPIAIICSRPPSREPCSPADTASPCACRRREDWSGTSCIPAPAGTASRKKPRRTAASTGARRGACGNRSAGAHACVQGGTCGHDQEDQTAVPPPGEGADRSCNAARGLASVLEAVVPDATGAGISTCPQSTPLSQ